MPGGVGGKAREGLPIPTVDLASPRGFEPLTYALGGHCAIQLCHGDRSLIIDNFEE